MMFRMKLRSGEDVTFHEWNTLKADLMYEYGYDKECLYDVLEQFVNNGVYRDMASDQQRNRSRLSNIKRSD